MATNNSTVADSAVDVLLTEEDILAFFLSKFGEVRNSELLAHFRRAIKSGRHRKANRQKFLQIVNHLATIREDADGTKILTLKEEFRHREDAAATAEDVGGEVDKSDTEVAMETTDETSQNDNDDNQTTSHAVDDETVSGKEDDMSETETNVNNDKEQSTAKDAEPETFNTNTDESLEDDKQRTQTDDKSDASTGSGNAEETQPVTEETATAGNMEGPGVSSTPKTTAEKRLLEGKSDDSANVDDRPIQPEPAMEETVDGDNFIDGGVGVSSMETAEKSLDGKSYDNGNDENPELATGETTSVGDNLVDGGIGVSSTPPTSDMETAEKSSLDGKSYDNGNVEDPELATDESAETTSGDDVVDGGPNVASADKSKMQTTGPKTPVVIVSEDQSTVEEPDEVDHRGVRELARRIDTTASKPESTATLRTKKQVRSELGRPKTARPVSTSYDFTMNESQREWMLCASYSDYQALAKLLGRHQGKLCTILTKSCCYNFNE